MGKCVAYMRVSTRKQADEGFGLDMQEHDIIEYAKKNDFVISKWYRDEGITGMKMDVREQLQEMISDINILGITDIIVFKVDRLARDGIDALWMIGKLFKPKGVTVHSVHDFSAYETPMDKFQTQIMSAVAEYDHDMIILKMRAGMLERVKQGFWMGGGVRPFAYKYDANSGILLQVPEKARMVKQAGELYMQGYSEIDIAKLLGFKTDCVVRNVLISKVNMGIIPYKGNEYKGLHEPIFSQEEWQALQDEREKRRNAKVNNKNQPCYMLSSLCYCGYCGCKMRYQKWSGGENIKMLWCCSHDKALAKKVRNHNPNCTQKSVASSIIEKQIEDEVKKIAIEFKSGKSANRQSNIEILNESEARETAKLKRLYNLYATAEDDNLLQVIEETRNNIEAIKAEIEKEKNSNNQEDKIKAVAETASRIADVWDDLDNVKKNKILKTFIKKIVITGEDVAVYLYI